MKHRKNSETRGILNVRNFKQHAEHLTFLPRKMLRDYIEHFWLISWELPDGKGHKQSVIPHPNTHISFLKNSSHIQGVHKKKYTHTLEGSGNIIGIKFKPAGFYPFAQRAGITMNAICNKRVDIDSIFNIHTGQVEQHVLALSVPEDKISYLEAKLFGEKIIDDKQVKLLNAVVEQIKCDKEIMQVKDISQTFGIESRQLQRLFSKYIGLTPKWIINRYRMHDAIFDIESKKKIDWAHLAIQLGYYDQSHFSKDFKALIGLAPKEYMRSLGIKKRSEERF